MKMLYSEEPEDYSTGKPRSLENLGIESGEFHNLFLNMG